jgi:hypothetical protein
LLINIANTNEQLVIDFYQKVYYNCTVVKVLHLFFYFYGDHYVERSYFESA